MGTPFFTHSPREWLISGMTRQSPYIWLETREDPLVYAFVASGYMVTVHSPPCPVPALPPLPLAVNICTRLAVHDFNTQWDVYSRVMYGYQIYIDSAGSLTSFTPPLCMCEPEGTVVVTTYNGTAPPACIISSVLLCSIVSAIILVNPCLSD